MSKALKSYAAARAWLLTPFSPRRFWALGIVAGDLDGMARFRIKPRISWSQDGEDFILEKLERDPGFYVDVGAHHPHRFSVTKRLYQAGWSGISIDFTTSIDTVFPRERPRDINVRALVGPSGSAKFFRFAEPALSTLDPERAKLLQQSGEQLASVEDATVTPLSMLLPSLTAPRVIGLLTVDVEGMDLPVLESHDGKAYPVIRCLVEISQPAYLVRESPVAEFLATHGLLPTRVLQNSVLFERVGEADPSEASPR